MPGQKSFIENRHPGFYTDKYGISRLIIRWIHKIRLKELSIKCI